MSTPNICSDSRVEVMLFLRDSIFVWKNLWLSSSACVWDWLVLLTGWLSDLGLEIRGLLLWLLGRF